jgi:hypothetical protein
MVTMETKHPISNHFITPVLIKGVFGCQGIIGNDFLNRTPIAQEIIARINK